MGVSEVRPLQGLRRLRWNGSAACSTEAKSMTRKITLIITLVPPNICKTRIKTSQFYRIQRHYSRETV